MRKVLLIVAALVTLVIIAGCSGQTTHTKQDDLKIVLSATKLADLGIFDNSRNINLDYKFQGTKTFYYTIPHSDGMAISVATESSSGNNLGVKVYENGKLTRQDRDPRLAVVRWHWLGTNHKRS